MRVCRGEWRAGSSSVDIEEVSCFLFRGARLERNDADDDAASKEAAVSRQARVEPREFSKPAL